MRRRNHLAQSAIKFVSFLPQRRRRLLDRSGRVTGDKQFHVSEYAVTVADSISISRRGIAVG